MSSFWGYVFLVICIVMGIGLWICNVLVVDNAIPPILDAITQNFHHSLMPADKAIFYLRLVDYAPLFIWLLGIVGFIAECTIWGNSEEQV